MTVATATRRLLRSQLVDLLVGPHGIDRYLELLRPENTIHDARARVLDVRRQTERSVTMTLQPNAAWAGFQAGQFVKVGVEIDGVRRTRTYSPASSEHGELVELTVTTHPDGLVSNYLRDRITAGAIVHLGEAQGSFVLPAELPDRIVLISGGSGITPVLSMLRTLCEQGYDGEVVFSHYARTRADWLYRLEVEALAARHGNLRVSYAATREDGARITPDSLLAHDGAAVAVCGPPRLIDAARDCWDGELITETFTPPTLTLAADAASPEKPAAGTLQFRRSDLEAPIAAGTLLEQAEAAGLQPDFGCRMGICHTCTCRKSAGAVRNVLTGEVSEEEDEDIQLCISVPAGDVALEL